MDSIPYALGVFERHIAYWNAPGEPSSATTCMELGPGDSLLTLIFARAAGFGRTILIDQGLHARFDPEIYIAAAEIMARRGHHVPCIERNWTMDDFLRAYQGEYLTNGLLSLRDLPSDSVDFSFSHAVLEHLPAGETAEFMRELRRVTKPGSVSSHVVDLRDHLGGSIQHLRFDGKEWESGPVRRSGVYTNRLRFSQWSEVFVEAGWEPGIVERQYFAAVPVDRRRLAPAFASLSEDDLKTHGFHALLTKPAP